MKTIFFLVFFFFLTSCTSVQTQPSPSSAKITPYIASFQILTKQQNSQGSVFSKTTTCTTPNRIVLVGGCFDILHNAHHDYLRRSRARGDYLIVALEPDESIIAYKKRQPVFNQRERAENLVVNRYVDEVLLLPKLKGYKDYMQLVRDVCPSVIAVTAGDPQIENIKKQAASIGAEVVEVIRLVDGVSTTELIRKIKNM